MLTPIKTALSILAILLASIYATSLVHATSQSDAASKDQRKLVTSKGCVSCHGTRGQGKWLVRAPKLAGRSQLELETLLKSYRNGEHTNSAMNTVTSDLTDQEIKIMAQYFSQF